MLQRKLLYANIDGRQMITNNRKKQAGSVHLSLQSVSKGETEMPAGGFTTNGHQAHATGQTWPHIYD